MWCISSLCFDFRRHRLRITRLTVFSTTTDAGPVRFHHMLTLTAAEGRMTRSLHVSFVDDECWSYSFNETPQNVHCLWNNLWLTWLMPILSTTLVKLLHFTLTIIFSQKHLICVCVFSISLQLLASLITFLLVFKLGLAYTGSTLNWLKSYLSSRSF